MCFDFTSPPKMQKLKKASFIDVARGERVERPEHKEEEKKDKSTAGRA